MYLDCLRSHLAVCAQPDLPNYAKRDKDYWNLISIREPQRAKISPLGFKAIHTSIFDDVVGLEQLPPNHRYLIPKTEHLKKIIQFADSVSGEPLLIHCWAGESRSTAVALAILVKAMQLDGYSMEEIVTQAPAELLAIRKQAKPNHLVLTLALELSMENEKASQMVFDLLHYPGLYSNIFPGASPAGGPVTP